MKTTTHAILLTAVLLAPAAANAGGGAQDQKPQGKLITLEQLVRAIDESLVWLKAQQDPETGSYGNVYETARVLEVLAVCPRQYRYGDGTFVSKALDFLLASQQTQGGIHEPGANPIKARVASLAAMDALRYFVDVPRVPEAIARCAAVTESAGEREAPWEYVTKGIPTEELLLRAENMLWTRHPDGYWPLKDDGAFVSKLRRTCTAVERLSGYYKIAGARLGGAGYGNERPILPVAESRAVVALQRGSAFLVGAAQAGRWSFGDQEDPGLTAMAVASLLATPEPRTEEAEQAIAEGLAWLASLQKEDGSIHAGRLPNYVTSAAILAFVRSGREEHGPVVERARAFLQTLQADEAEGHEPGDRFYGGIGYGGDQRPDLSNLHLAMDALQAAGVRPGDETFRKALVFLQRCQNRSESNDLVLTGEDGIEVKSGNDGGSAYAPGESKAGFVELPDGTRVPRSYGSMSYALLKGYLFAGLNKEDPRVRAVWGWLQNHYTLDVNPGFDVSADPKAAYQGLFYYYSTLASTLELFGQEYLIDAKGKSHSWRKQILRRVNGMQRQDGSWINENSERWYEGEPVLATCYAMLALSKAIER